MDYTAHIQKGSAYGETTETCIADFEKQVLVSLPQSYRSFLLQTNGGIPIFQFFDYDEDGSEVTARVELFYGLGDGPIWASLETTARGYVNGKDEDEDPGVIPIALVAGGQLALRCGKGAREGEICFKSTEWLLFPAGRSFDEFFMNLRSEE